jgi:hypothetical protein
MAIEDPNRNPFLGVYKKPQGKKPSNVGMGQPQDFLSSEEVIGRPDAQNTAQRSKASSTGLKDAYEAVTKGSGFINTEQQAINDIGEYQKFRTKWSGIKGNPFTGAKRDAFEAILNKRELTPKQAAIYEANRNEFDSLMGNIESFKKPFGDLMSLGPRSLMAVGESKTKGQVGQSSSTANVARYGESEYTSPTMLPANVSRFETLGFGVPKGYSTSTQAPLNLPMTQGQLNKRLSDEEAARAKAIIESHK